MIPKIRNRKAEYEQARLAYRRKEMKINTLSPEQRKRLEVWDMEYASALRKHLGLKA